MKHHFQQLANKMEYRVDLPNYSGRKSKWQAFEFIAFEIHNRLRRSWDPSLKENSRTYNQQEICMMKNLIDEDIPLTKYCSIRGQAMEGSIFPTMTTVKVDGSLKQLLKYSQALIGSTFLRSPIFMG